MRQLVGEAHPVRVVLKHSKQLCWPKFCLPQINTTRLRRSHIKEGGGAVATALWAVSLV
jgi:hypothetical protein